MTLAYWHWIILGLGMVAVEVIVPGAFFIWIGITALVLGGATFLFPAMSFSVQLVLFGTLAPLITIMGRKIIRTKTKDSTPPLLNRRGQQFVGETIVLDVPIVNGRAHVTVGDSKWRIKGPDFPAGTVVKVVGVEGNILVIVKNDG